MGETADLPRENHVVAAAVAVGAASVVAVEVVLYPAAPVVVHVADAVPRQEGGMSTELSTERQRFPVEVVVADVAKAADEVAVVVHTQQAYLGAPVKTD